MAFKMKGFPMQQTSALKQGKSPIKDKQPKVEGHNIEGEEAWEHAVNKHPYIPNPDDIPDLKRKKNKKDKKEEGEGGVPMKSPMKQEQDLTTMSVEELKALSNKLIAEAEEKAKNSMYWEDTGDDEYTEQDQKMLINEYTTNEDYNPDAAVLKQIVEIMKSKLESGEI
jgi:hypothetical protein